MKATRRIPVLELTKRLYRQSAEIELYAKLYRYKGSTGLRKDQIEEVWRIRDTFPEKVTEPFTPRLEGESHWPFRLGEVDLMKLAWAMHIGQEAILVDKNAWEVGVK